MRCNNCGWENNPGNMKCEKCNAPLKGSMIDNGNHASQADQSSNSPSDNRPLRGTLNEKDAFNNTSFQTALSLPLSDALDGRKLLGSVRSPCPSAWVIWGSLKTSTVPPATNRSEIEGIPPKAPLSLFM